MLFSVVIPTYNRASYLRATLDSLQAQEFTDYETIVVDDGSTDGTLSILSETPWVRVLRQENKGPGAARNLGASQCSGQYIAFLDSDDVWFPWTLKTFAEAIRVQNEPDLVAAKLFEFYHERELESVKEEPLKVDIFQDY
ncbi:MAG: family 2 glycosyl transferase, partial [Verrucomicrobia bacterium]